MAGTGAAPDPAAAGRARLTVNLRWELAGKLRCAR